MIVTIHQPEHLPWLGFFNKIDQADLFVLLDVVQFRKNYFQNRNRVLGPNGPIWLTVPVSTEGHLEKTIRDMLINNAVSWREKYWKSIFYSYKKHPYFNDHASFFEETMAKEWRLLAELNEAIIDYFCRALGIKTKVIKASELNLSGSSSELLLDICRKTGARTYLAGQTARDYLNEKIFNEEGIKVIYHQFRHPVYPQFGRAEFESHLSLLDLLFNCGRDSLEIVRQGSL